MLVESVIADYFETNCWILAPNKNSECLLIDPGIFVPDLLPRLRQILESNNLKPVALLITHGHLDHTFSVVPIADRYGIPALMHKLDRGALLNPYQVISKGGPTETLLKSMGISTFSEPNDVREIVNGESFTFCDMEIDVIHSPGHTAGSTMFRIAKNYLVSGDVLFKGGIGRTDMPSGSMSEMKLSLATKVRTLPGELIVLPGHGPQTTIDHEKKSNPYLQDDFLLK